MGRFDNLRQSIAELIDGSRDEEPEPEGYQGEERSSGLIRGGALEHDPPRDDLNFYRKLYENVGPIKSAIDNFSSEVVEPGWYITCDNEETAEQLTEYFRNVAIINTETDVNASRLIESMVREREIKGTVFLEKVTDSENRNQALYPLQNDTITIYTKPGKAMLPAPDDSEAEAFNPDIDQSRDQPPLTDDGEMGAYVQFDELKPQWAQTNEVVYTRDQVIKWTRDAEIGEPRGTSRIASSARRAEGLLEKLQDNDDAVKFKAWPQIIFQLGDEDNPWNEEEVQNFISAYEDGQISPGMMQAVAGDVSVEEFAGDTADIQDTLNFDISMIMSGLPGPVYATGGFAQNVAPAVAQSQQRTFIKEVKKTRREVEQLFTPYLRDVATDYGLDGADSVELHLGRPNGEVAPEDVEGSIIRYTSDATNGEQEQPITAISSDDIVTDPDDVEEERQAESDANSSSSSAENTGTVSVDNSFRVTTEPGTAELAGTVGELSDPRLVSTRDIESDLSDLLYEELVNVREQLVSVFEDTADRSLRNSDELDGAIARAVSEATGDARIDPRSRDHFERAIEATLDTLSQPNHSPQIELDMGARHRQRARFLSDAMADSFENVVGDMDEFARVNTTQAVQHDESPAVVGERLAESFDNDDLRERADVMARIEIMSGVNALKMAEYDRHDEIIGVELINPCNPNTTPLCKELTCDDGDGSVALFDADQTLGEQFQADVPDDMLFDGFDPLPTVPPFHFNCRTEIVPVTQLDADSA